MCPLLGVSRSKYYAWIARGREPTYAALDRRLLVLIRSLHREWKGIIGYRRMHTCLQQQYGEYVGKHRVRRLMRLAGLMGIPKKRRRAPRPGRREQHIPDWLQRDFSATEPNRVWVTDITELATGEGKLYLCVIKDLYDGAMVAWKTGPRPTAKWVTATVESALVKRPESRGAILHSDHGSQYTSNAYRQCLQRHGLQISMGKVRTCADNASAESVFGQLKRELIRRCQFRSRQEATEKINHYFLNLYNSWRRPPLLSKKPNVIQTDNSRQHDALC